MTGMEEALAHLVSSFLLPFCCAVLFGARRASSMARFDTTLSGFETYLEASMSESESSGGGGRCGMVRVLVKAKAMTKRSSRDALSGHVLESGDFSQSRTRRVALTAL